MYGLPRESENTASDLTPRMVATSVVILLLSSLLLQAVWRAFIHPFRSIPGPWINSVSELPAALHLVKGQQHLYYRALHEQYGPVVRVSPDELSFVSVEAREEIYGHRKAGLMEKSPIFLGAVGKVDGQTGVSLALDADHARQRRALGFVFTNSSLLRHEEILGGHIHKLLATMEAAAAAEQALNMSNWYTYLMFDIMGDLCFAEPFGCLDQASATEWSASIINVFVAATWTQAIRRLAGVGTMFESLLLKLLIPSRAARWKVTHLHNSMTKTSQRLANTERDHPDFLQQILASESCKQLSQTEVALNMALFMSAGTDTTATALTGWTYFVCTHPHVYARVADEVRGAFTRTSDIDWHAVRPLRYLDATINEALRLFPPSAASQQRIVPTGGATIDGTRVPAGKTVAVAPWASTRSKLNFYKPDEFIPERWLDADTCPDANAPNRLAASVPFGNGPRVCVGRNLALMEMRLVAAHVLWRFDIGLDMRDGGAANEPWGADGHLRPPRVFHSMTKPNLWVRVRVVGR